MATRTGDTREEILKVASGLLQTRGFSAFSYAHIAEALGVKTAAVHYHFPTKADLGLALIDRYRARYRRWMDEAEDQGLGPAAQLDGYVRIAARFGEDGQKICPVGALEAEYGAIPPEMQRAVQVMIEEIYAWLGRVLDQGRKSGDFHFEGSPQDMAVFIASALQGGLQVGRALGKARFDAVLRQLRRELAS